MRLLTVGFVLLLALALPSVSEGQTTEAPAAQAPLQLRPGDVLVVTVWRQPELSGEMVVAADGTLVHPLYREVQAADVPLDLVEARLREVIERFETGSYFAIQPLIRVSIGGQVRSPNLYTLSPETTVAQAVALAGGPTERGRLDHVELIRDGQLYVLDLTRLPTEGQVGVRSGDQISLARRRTPVFQSVIVPVVSFVAATASVVNIFR